MQGIAAALPRLAMTDAAGAIDRCKRLRQRLVGATPPLSIASAAKQSPGVTPEPGDCRGAAAPRNDTRQPPSECRYSGTVSASYWYSQS
jgi:hypothetical protein